MLLSDTTTAMLTAQIGHELANRNLYLAAAAWCQNRGLAGLAGYFSKQAAGEAEHADKFIGFLTDLNYPVNIPVIPAQSGQWADLADLAQAALEREVSTTGLIYSLVDQAKGANERVLESFLDWFVLEQVEEIATSQDLVDRAAACCGNPLIVDLLYK